jgi:sugar/nucleoside kinase (ribokinase family)
MAISMPMQPTSGNGNRVEPILDVLLPGRYSCDLVFSGLREMPTLGKEIYGDGFTILPGGSYPTAVGLHLLGLRTAWLADFGSDFFSQFVLKAARQAGLDDSFFRIHDFPLPFKTVSISIPGKQAIFRYQLPSEEMIPAQEITRLKPRCLLVPDLISGPESIPLFLAAHRQGSLVFIDCQSVQVSLKDDPVAEAIRSADILAVNLPEALHLTGLPTPEQALNCLAALVPLVVIKLGKEGVIARTENQVFRIPPNPNDGIHPDRPKNCFSAGFLSGYLKGKSIAESLRLGIYYDP